ncbi:MAG: hypothetical protein ACI31W_02210, partial [Lactococcus sp.]
LSALALSKHGRSRGVANITGGLSALAHSEHGRSRGVANITGELSALAHSERHFVYQGLKLSRANGQPSKVTPIWQLS